MIVFPGVWAGMARRTEDRAAFFIPGDGGGLRDCSAIFKVDLL